MNKCSRCGSLAINHKLHGRDGKDGDLCDVCYWRKRAEKTKVDKLALLSDIGCEVDMSEIHWETKEQVLSMIQKRIMRIEAE